MGGRDTTPGKKKPSHHHRSPTGSTTSSGSSNGSWSDGEGMPSFRQSSIELFARLFATNGFIDPHQALAMAMEVENALFAHHGNRTMPTTPTREYVNKLRSLRYNIGQNADLEARILSGALSSEAIARLTPDEMLPSQAREALQETEARAHELRRLDRLSPEVVDEIAKRGMVEGGH